MTALAVGPTAVTAATSRWLPSLASCLLPATWAFYLTVVLALGLWVAVPTVALGWESATILSGSMEPAVRSGDVVVFEPYRGQQLGEGDVVTFYDDQRDRLVTHRVTEVHADGSLRTRGDANPVDDPAPVTPDRITGRGRLLVPAAGLPMLWAHQGRIELLAVFAGLTVLAAWGAASTVSAHRHAGHDAAPSTRRRPLPRSGPAMRLARRLVIGGCSLIVLTGGAANASQGFMAAFFDTDDNAGNSFAATTLGTPSGLSASASCQLLLVGPKVDLSWTGAAGATAYSVHRSTSSGGPYSQVATTSSTSHTDTNVSGNTRYYYVVRSTAGSWVSGNSNQASAKTPSLCL